MSLMGNTSSPTVKIYQITYIFGVTLGSILYFGINKIFPPPGLGVNEEFEDMVVMNGFAPSDSTSQSRVETQIKAQISSDVVASRDLKT
jgi:hypothetical protein